MPELPEVEIVRGGLEAALQGDKIVWTQVNRYDLRELVQSDFVKKVEGNKFVKFERRGKYILMTLTSGLLIVLHLGMSGRIRIYPSKDSYLSHKHDHILFYTLGKKLVVFEDPRRFGFMRYLHHNLWYEAPPFCLMGPEPLDKQAWRGSDLYVAIQNKTVAIKNALLDQKIVAGLGNIYVCEALYGARINPLRICSSLSQKECTLLVQSVRSVLEKALRAGGSTLKDYKKTDGSLGYFQHQFSVYDRENQKCPNCNCNEGVIRVVQSGRSTFYCPVKQKLVK